ncbi:hypothetical protein KUL118_01270 [Tenacibaculum sp. KUL118]|nr:hypothetical protein KUL118_01270 [Tenacibaculum sp. KUL118]
MHPELTKQLKTNCQKLGIAFEALDLIGESETQIKDITIKIERDGDIESPREWDNVGTMVCWHRRYNLGDEQPSVSYDDYRIGMVEAVEPGFEAMLERFEHNWPSTSWDAQGTKSYQELVEAKIAARLEKYYFILPLYLYDHSGITMNRVVSRALGILAKSVLSTLAKIKPVKSMVLIDSQKNVFKRSTNS